MKNEVEKARNKVVKEWRDDFVKKYRSENTFDYVKSFWESILKRLQAFINAKGK